MIEVKCPKCGSTSFDCCDIDSNTEQTIYWNKCYCDDCDAVFSVTYIATEIELID